jgi:molybdopterin-guanine dinucleotide biosynthesis protein A
MVPPVPAEITGLVLAGGRGLRMGGLDKGLQPLEGRPLAAHALQRLAPQVGPLMISANRNLPAYAALGAPVWPDADAGFAGPLAGLLAGLDHCTTPWLASVPCDAPCLPADLVARLSAAVAETGADMAVAATREAGLLRPQPVFCLLHTQLRAALREQLACGRLAVQAWADAQRAVRVVFEDAAAFLNANTLAQLQRIRCPSTP